MKPLLEGRLMPFLTLIVSVEMFRTHNPGFVKEYIAPTPFLMTVTEADNIDSTGSYSKGV